jgi:hypothetical protein
MLKMVNVNINIISFVIFAALFLTNSMAWPAGGNGDDMNVATNSQYVLRSLASEITPRASCGGFNGCCVYCALTGGYDHCYDTACYGCNCAAILG